MEPGYRHIDTTQAYGNERGVGEGLRAYGIAREKLFVTSKVAAEYKSKVASAKPIDETLSKMKLDYIDLMLIHTPQPWAEWRSTKRYFKENREVWKALEDAYKAGKVRAIGVSNFLIDDLTSLCGDCEIMPMAHQILVHIGNTPLPLIEFARSEGILVEAYAPLGQGEIFKDEKILAMASKYGVSLHQLYIRYTLQLGTVSLPKASSIEHMKQNASVDFTISDKDMEYLSSLKSTKGYGQSSHFLVFSGK